MRHLDETTITQAVLATHSTATNARLSEVMTSLVQHLHAFARDIKLTEQEWQSGIAFLEQAGKAGTPDHCEVALLSHVLGLSTLVLAQDKTRPVGCTDPAVLACGPRPAARLCDQGADIAPDEPGTKTWVQGTVKDDKGQPVPHATVQVMASGTASAGLLQADAKGRFRFISTLPQPQPLETAGPVAALLTALDRPAWRPAHLTFAIQAAGYHALTTVVFLEDAPCLASDALFEVRASLIAECRHRPEGITADGRATDGPLYTLDFDFVLAPA